MADIFNYDPMAYGSQAPNVYDIFNKERTFGLEQQTRALQGIQERRLLTDQQTKAAAAADYQAQVAELMKDPSPERVRAFMVRNPGAANETKAAFDLKDSETQTRDLRDASELYAQALRNPKGAGAKMRERAASTQDTDDDQIANWLESDDPNLQRQALAWMGTHVAAISGKPDELMKAYQQYYTRDYGEAGGLFYDKNSNQFYDNSFWQSPYAKSVVGPAGIDYYPQAGGAGVLGGGGVMAPPRVSTDGTTPPPPGTSGGSPIPAGSINLSDGADVFNKGVLVLETRGQHFSPDGKVITSPKGAVGIAQLMPKTAVEAAKLAGEPFDLKRLASDPAYNQRLGYAYYNKQLKDFGQPLLAAAAYNGGPGTLRKALKQGGPNGWINYLPQETKDYVTRIAGGAQQAQSQTLNGKQYVKMGADWYEVKG